jgi:hypothetical protein
MRELADEELKKALQFLGIAPARRRERRGIDLRCLQRTHVKLKPVAEPLDASEHAHRVALAEAAVEQLDVVPNARVDAAARVDELEREERRTRFRPQLPLRLDREHAIDDPVLGELGDHAPTLR